MNNNNIFPYKWKKEESKDNQDILIINNKYIHSKFSPSKEGENFVYKGRYLIVIFGIGFAYHINNIIKNNPDSIFIIFEPFQQIFELYKKYIDIELLKKYKDNICLLDNINHTSILDFLEKNNLITENRMLTYSNLGYRSLCPELEKEYFQDVKKNLQIILQNTLTESNFIPLWTKNFLKNMTNLYKVPFFIPQKHQLDDNIAVIVSAGPGLSYDIKTLKNKRDKITIFAVDTAIKPLLSNEIIPDFIVSLDGQFYSIDDFINNIPDETTFILDAIAYPGITRLHKNIFFTITKNIFDTSIIEYFFNYHKLNDFGIITGGTVSDYCLNLAVLLGFKNIYLAGLDLSFPLLQSHCKGSPFYNRAIFLSNYFESPQSIIIKSIAKRKIKEAISKNNEKKILTDFVFQNYAFHFSKFVKQNNFINIYNSIHEGLKIPDLVEKKLSLLIEETESKRIMWKELINKSNNFTISKKKSEVFFKSLLNSIYEKSLQLSSCLEKIDFNTDNIEELSEFIVLFNSIFKEFPFLKKFIIMTEIILQKKKITKENILWYKHAGNKTLQSIYYVIRILQKILKQM